MFRKQCIAVSAPGKRSFFSSLFPSLFFLNLSYRGLLRPTDQMVGHVEASIKQAHVLPYHRLVVLSLIFKVSLGDNIIGHQLLRCWLWVVAGAPQFCGQKITSWRRFLGGIPVPAKNLFIYINIHRTKSLLIHLFHFVCVAMKFFCPANIIIIIMMIVIII